MAADNVNQMETALRRVKKDLNDLKLNWAVVGGVAVSVRGNPRFTNDLDTAVAVESDQEAEAVVSALMARGYRVFAQLEADDGRMTTVRLWCPNTRGTEIILDLLFASTGIEPEIIRAAGEVEVFRGLRVPVAQIGHLIAMKLVSVRESRKKDDLDLDDLIARAGPEDIELARAAIAHIAEAGRERDRDLSAMLDEYLARRPPPTAG